VVTEVPQEFITELSENTENNKGKEEAK
jgi:hypothetical protein